MKKNLTKLLALMMALALVFSLAACGDKTEEQSTNPSENPAVAESGNDDVTLDPADPDAMTSSEDASADASNETPSENVTTPDGGKVTNPDSGKTTPAASADKGLNSTDKAEIIKFYQAAANKMTKTNKKQNLSLVGDLSGEGAIANLVSKFSSNINNALSKNSTVTQGVPGGYSKLVASDLISASAKSDGKYTNITMKVKEQTDGAKSSWDRGPVGHAIGVLGDVDGAIKELGVPVKYEDANIKLTYKSPMVTAKIDNNTGKIVSATWGYDVHIDARDITVAYVIPIQKVNGVVREKVVMPA